MRVIGRKTLAVAIALSLAGQLTADGPLLAVGCRDEFQKRIVGLRSGTVYWQAPVGVFLNGSTTCSGTAAAAEQQGVAPESSSSSSSTSSLPCLGSSPGVHCVIVCSGKGMGMANITLTTAATGAEELIVELRTGSLGSTHALTTLQLHLPSITTSSGSDKVARRQQEQGEPLSGWEFTSGFEEAEGRVVRALYNATAAAFTKQDTMVEPAVDG